VNFVKTGSVRGVVLGWVGRSIVTAALLATLLGVAPPAGADWSGDGKTDILAVDGSGYLRMYRGNGAGGWVTGNAEFIGSGWGTFTSVVQPGDFTNDGNPDILAVDASGYLRLYRGNGQGAWSTGNAEYIGAQWNIFSRIAAPGDWDGDGSSDVLGVKSNGEVHLYRGDGRGAWLTGQGELIGTIFNTATAVVTAGDFSGDRKPDLLVKRSDDTFWMYRGNGAGGWVTGSAEPLGSGWSFPTIAAPGDFSGDGKPDVVAVTTAGQLVMYRGNGTGAWITGIGESIGGAGWGPLRVLSGQAAVWPADGVLVRSKSDPTPYYLEHGMRFGFASADVASVSGLDFGKVRVWTDADLAAVPRGPDIAMGDLPGPDTSQTLLRQKKSFVVASSGAPMTYTWRPVLPSDHRLRIDSNGNVVLVRPGGADAGVLARRWAEDDEDQPVAVSFAIEGSTTVRITISPGTGTTYPIVVDTNTGVTSDEDVQRINTQLNDAYAATEPTANPSTDPADYLLSPGETLDLGTQAQAAGMYDDLNDLEREFCVAHPITCYRFWRDKQKAYRLTLHLFDTRRNHTRANAFQHSFWVALMTNSVRPENYALALDFGVRHENHEWENGATSEDRLGSWMDLQNNTTGWTYASEYAEDHNDEFMCNGMRHKIEAGEYNRDRQTWESGRLVWIQRGVGLRSGRTCRSA